MSWPLGLRRAVALAIGVFIGSAFALGQEASGPPAKDTIFARKILMGAIDMKMEEIETMLAPNGKFDAAEAQEHADTIRDPATDTFASPELWANFADFYQRASTASNLAQQASTTKRMDEFRKLIGQLRTACNGCHEKYMKTN